jgi:hypothetical protein
MRRSQSTLVLLDLSPQPFDEALIFRHVFAMLLQENFHDMLQDMLMKVLTSQVRITT